MTTFVGTWSIGRNRCSFPRNLRTLNFYLQKQPGYSFSRPSALRFASMNPESLLAGLAVQAGLEVSPEMDGLLGSSEASKLWWEV